MANGTKTTLEEKSVDTAVEAIKQQITLSSAVIAGTVAFASSLKEANVREIWQLLPWALVPFAVAIVCGVFALQSISFELKSNRLPFAANYVRRSGIAQNFAFVAGFVALVVIVIKT